MEQSQQVLLKVWQEACRHIEIGQSTANIAAMLACHVPVEQVLVRRIDSIRSGLETVAAGFSESSGHRVTRDHPDLPVSENGTVPYGPRTNCSPAELQSLLQWCRRGKVSHRCGEESAVAGFALLASHQHDGDVMIGPLGDPAGHCGLLVLLASDGRTFTAEHLQLVQLLLEPISVAFDNDLRLREMAALREAAEADKRSLLTRLGRKTLGDTIVGVESGLHAVMDRVELVARSDAPVLIFGETGTGKELIARAIHNRSPRSSGPFDRVNCGAIPPELIDSQLFGHERARSPAPSRRGAAGSSGPTAARCFSTRSANCPPPPRSACCESCKTAGWSGSAPRSRSMWTCESSPPRTPIWRRWSPRGIFARTCGIASRSSRSCCRRCASVARTSPSWPSISPSAATRFGLAPVAPKPEDLGMLTAYSWPGNVRELAAVIDRAAILGDGKRLDVATALGVTADSPHNAAAGGRTTRLAGDSGRWKGGSTAAKRWGGSSTATPTEVTPTENPTAAANDAAPTAPIESLDAAIRRHIESALAAATGRIEGRQGAAAMLKINPHTLRAKMRKLGIDWARFRG